MLHRTLAVIFITAISLAAVEVSEAPRPILSSTAVAALIANDPQQAAELGRILFTRQFTAREGAGAARRTTMRGAQAQSCGVCHNVPYGEAGSGATIGRSGPTGRNTPHLFGAGLQEKIGRSITSELLKQVDRNGDGWVGASEAQGRRATIDPDGAGPEATLDFGAYLTDDHIALDPALRIWYVASDGRRIPAARALTDPGVAGYRFSCGTFGWSADDGEDPRATASLRGFVVGAFAAHAGLEVDDPQLSEDDGSGFSQPEFDGTRSLFIGALPDPGIRRDTAGRSLDDPDGDGVPSEMTGSDIDLVTTYLRTLAQPIERTGVSGFQHGRELFASIGCTACHVPDWHLPNLNVSGIYSDFRHHDLGPGFHQRRFDGGMTTRFRTPPLWGVGTSAPYGHDGASLDLPAVIERHAGEATAAAMAYAALTHSEQADFLAFLRGLVLPQSGTSVNFRQ